MKNLRTLTLVFNLFIIIAAGHGAAPLGLFELVYAKDLITGNFQFSVSGSYEERLMTVVLISLPGQFILLSSYFFTKKVKSMLTLAGCSILFLATFILTKNAFGRFSADQFSVFTALPFIGTALFLSLKEIKELRKT